MTSTVEALNGSEQYAAVRLVAATNQTVTFFNGPLNNGVQATLTYATGVLTIDSVVTNLNDYILIAGQTLAYQNGIYQVVVNGAVGVAAVLQRRGDFQCIEQMRVGHYVPVAAGTGYGGSMWTMIEPKPAAVGVPVVSGANNINFSSLAAVLSLSSGESGLSALGVHSATFSSSFPTATTVVTDPAITAASVVIARFVSSANVVTVQTVLPAAGSFTVVTDTAPGAGVLEYISYIPSVALQNAGVIAGKGSYGGGSATFVISDPLVTAGMVVNANFQSEVTPSRIYTVTAGAGTLTFVCSANPGVSVVEYAAVLPSAPLTALGLEAVNYAYAGGFASIVISDPLITASSIVTADFKSQSVVALIQKVTPSAGTLTILASIDPGPSVVAYTATSAATGGTFLTSTNNLSDVTSASTSLANLGGLPLAGGQMTGQLLLDRGTATSTAGAATINHQAGVVTTEALTTAAAAAYAFTLTDSRILTTSVVVLQLMGGSNTTRGLELRAIPGAGSAAISIYNNNVAGTALNGTLIFGFEVI
jgi:hypothetical protein